MADAPQPVAHHSNAFGRRRPGWRPLVAAVAVAAAFAAGWAGARLAPPAHATPGPVTRSDPIGPAIDDSGHAVTQEPAGASDDLALRVGILQARLIAIQALVDRIVTASGIALTEPEVQAALDAVSSETAAPPASSSTDLMPEDAVADPLANVSRRMDAQEDQLAMLDMMITRRAALDAALPSLHPVDYPWQSSSFGWRRHPITGRHTLHEGLDFAAPRGAPIYAASPGMVIAAGAIAGYGKTVDIAHGSGVVTRYAHASRLLVKQGDLVQRGQVIAHVGSTGRSTGPHLHFEVRLAGHALDPTLFLPAPDLQAPQVAAADDTARTQP